MLELKGYITNLGKYNEGELVGEYITFPIDEDELEEVFNRIGINEEYEEFFFTDWECSVNLNLGEYVSINDVNELAEKLENWDEECLESVLELWNLNYALEHGQDAFNFMNDIETDYDLGYYWLVESGCYDLKHLGILENYIDFESFGRDVRFESDGGFTSNGWVEYVG